jgi:sulfoxide reductase heme-binding subunit YedZ
MKKRVIWWLVFLVGLSPSLWLLGAWVFSPRSLGIDPVESVLQESGEWALRFLLITLACSPLKRAGFKQVIRFRRMLGLFAYFYASIHLMTYVVGWIELDWSLLLEDLLERPFIYVGMITWLFLGVLAITSPKAMVKKLKKNWVVLHRGVYAAVILAWVHLWMQSRASASEAVLYGAFILMLLGERLYRRVVKSYKTA